VKVRSIVHSIQPQGKVDGLWPVGAHVKQLLARALQEVLDGLLGDAILEVGINPTKGELLSCITACLLKGIVVKAPIVAVLVHDFDSVFGRIQFKSEFGGNCFG
jgi:hypothetical protein